MSEGGGETGGIAGRGRRGRARWLTPVVLGMCCLAGAAAGFLRTRPVYRSGVLLQYTAADVAIEVGWNKSGGPPVPGALLSRQTVALATRGPDWEPSWPTGPEAERWYFRRLSGGMAGGGAFYDDIDPRLARDRLNAFVRAHVRAVSDYLEARRADRLKAIEERRSLVEAEIATAERMAGDAAVEEKQAPDRVSAFSAELRRREAERRRDRLRGELKALDGQRDDVRATAVGGAVVMSPATPGAKVFDVRLRDAAWGAVLPLLVFVTLRAPFWWRSGLTRWRTGRARGAFPVVVAEVPTCAARPVVPLD